MNSEITKVLEKYKNIEFTYQEDKTIFLEFLEQISEKIKERNDLNSLLDILEDSFLSNSKFDVSVIYNPISLVDAIIENDLSGEKLDHNEIETIITKFHDFQDYLEGNIDRKKFLEKKYEIQIILIKKDTLWFDGNVTGKWLWKSLQISLIKKIEKLLNFYPINFIKNIKLDKLILAAYFTQKDQYGKEMRLWGFETLRDNNLYLSARSLNHSFDHELYHQATQYYDDFDQWMKIREEQDTTFRYANVMKISPWFARDYGKKNATEDQATIAEALVKDHNWITYRAKKDWKLAKKIELVKKGFYKLSDGVMNEEFWGNGK